MDRTRLAANLLVRALRATDKLAQGFHLFRQFAEIAAGEAGKPFAPVHFDFDSLDNRDPETVARIVSALVEPMEEYFESEVRGLDDIPREPLLYVGNHNGGAWSPEIFLFGSAVYRRHGLAGMPYGLAHETVIKIPPIARVLVPLGAVRASHENAARVFARGQSALVFPGGDEDAFRPSSERDRIVFAGRRGYVRLALRHGVPIVPVVAFGAHDTLIVLDDGRKLAALFGLDRALRMKVFPIVLTIPWGLTAGVMLPYVPLPARICIEVLEPIRFERSGEAAARDDDYVSACDELVRARMQACLTRLALEHRTKGLVPQALPGAADNDQRAVRSRRVA